MILTWHQRIAEAKERDHFTKEDVALARKWPTCACGEQDPRVPRYSAVEAGALNEVEMPKDDILVSCGLNFLHAIAGNQPSIALELLTAIELRSAEILAEIQIQGAR